MSFFELAKEIVSPPVWNRERPTDQDRRIREMPSAEIVELLKRREAPGGR